MIRKDEEEEEKILAMNDKEFLAEITAHALESKCACQICYLLRRRQVRLLRSQLGEMK